MKIWDRTKEYFQKIDSVLQCAVLYLGATALDFITSLHFPPGFEEANPFARHADGTFWLRHASITASINTLELTFISAGCYLGTRTLGPKWAKFAAGLPWLFFGYLHLDAAFRNILIEVPGLYVQTIQEFLRRLTGQ